MPVKRTLKGKAMVQQLMEFLGTILRTLHIIAGTGAVGVSLWFMFAASPFNPYGFGIFLFSGILLLLIGILSSRKDVIITFFSSGL